MKTFKFKLYCSKRNKHLVRQIEIAANIYNHCIALHKRYYRMFGKSLHLYQLQKHLTKLKKRQKYSFWKELGSQAIQDVTVRIDKAYKLFFRNLKHGLKTGPPSFKKRIRYRSFTLRQAGWKLLDANKIKVGKRFFRFHKSREIEGRIKTVTIKRDPIGDLYICFVVETPKIDKIEITTGKIAAFDFGLKTYLTISDGSKIESPQFFKKSIKEIRKACRNLSRKKHGSNNRKRARLKLARVYKKVANRRRYFHFKLAHQLTDNYDLLIFEDLNMRGMQRLWGRKISDLAFAEFLKIIEYVASEKKREIRFIDRFYPSSKICSKCGYKNKNLTLEDRFWTCPECSEHHDRDKNASENIKRVGASTLEVEDVRPASAG